MTSIVSNIVSFTAFEILDVKVLWPRSRTVQGHPRSKTMVPVDSTWVTSCLTFIDPNVISVTIFSICEYNFHNLELGQFKVIRGQRSCCQSIAHELFPIRLLLTHHRICHYFWNIWRVSLMTLNQDCWRSCKVKGHGANRKPIDGFRLLSDPIVSNIVSLTVFEIFDVQVVLWSRSRTVQGHPVSHVMLRIDSLWVISYSISIDVIIVSVTSFETFDL